MTIDSSNCRQGANAIQILPRFAGGNHSSPCRVSKRKREGNEETMARIASVTMATLIALTFAPLVSAHAAGFDCTKFLRNDDGSWRVVQALEIKGPQGRIDFTPDETYTEGHEKMGLDMAKLLNANCIKK